VERLTSKQVYATPWMTVREDEVRHLDGSTVVHAVVEAPDIALVVAVDGDRLQLVEQYRHPVGGRRWEFPSGSTDPQLDVDAPASARRELREETGLAAGSLIRLGTVEITPSTMTQRCWVFLATDLTHGAPQRDAVESDMEAAWFTRSQVEHMITDGIMTDAKSVAAYALYLMSLRLEQGTDLVGDVDDGQDVGAGGAEVDDARP
jgi:8-oxo-dGTP pyrophosphatase MutT (NUDIX family)